MRHFSTILTIAVIVLSLNVVPVSVWSKDMVGGPKLRADGPALLDFSSAIGSDGPIDILKPPVRTLTGWWTGVKERIERSEYHVSWVEEPDLPDVDAAWQAPNRTWNMRTWFLPGGIRAVNRTKAGPPWEWGLHLTGYGYEGVVDPAPPAVLKIEDNRVEYRRGELTEWYVNDPGGLEQGFTLNGSPSDASDNRDIPLVLEMTVSGGLEGKVNHNGTGVEFFNAEGTCVVRYDRLKVNDASGRLLAAGIDLEGKRLSLLIDASNAVFPVTVDPLVTSPSWTATGGQENSAFGCSVSGAGDVNRDGFDDVIVGACDYDHGQPAEGRVYVYHGSDTGLSTSPDWIKEPNKAYSAFGFSVSGAGDVNGDGFDDVVVGAPHYEHPTYMEGMVFVYHGSEDGLSSVPAWYAEGDKSNAELGYSVSGAGNVNGDDFDDVIVGAPGYRNDQTDEGRAYVFHGSDLLVGNVRAEPDWHVESDQAYANLGWSVSSGGDWNEDGYSDVLVGIPYFDHEQCGMDSGSVRMYYGSDTGLPVVPDSSNSWGRLVCQAGAMNGWSVSGAGDVDGDGSSDVIFGAPYFDGEELADVGYIGVLTQGRWREIYGDQARAHLGISVSGAGDVNGDGLSDLIVAASDYDDAHENEGFAWLYYGTTYHRLSEYPHWSRGGKLENARFGRSVSDAGDVNGDGFADVIVGAYGYSGDVANEGAAFLYRGKKDVTNDFNIDGHSDLLWRNTVTDRTVVWLMAGHLPMVFKRLPDTESPWDILVKGDFNRDNHFDILWQNTETLDIQIWQMNKTEFVTALTPDFSIRRHDDIPVTGDFNGDGYTDIVVWDRETGNVSVWFLDYALFAFDGDVLGDVPDWILAGGGDFNNDGHIDLLWRNPTTGENGFWIMNQTNFVRYAALPRVPLAWEIAATGDYNNDGKLDIVWRHPIEGHIIITFLDGLVYDSLRYVGAITDDWKIR